MRMHSHCLFGDVFGSAHCDCRRLIDESMRQIAAEGRGVLVYLHQSKPALQMDNTAGGTGRLLVHDRELLHYRTPDGSKLLQYESGVGAQILSDLGLKTIPADDQPPTQDRGAGGIRHPRGGASPPGDRELFDCDVVKTE